MTQEPNQGEPQPPQSKNEIQQEVGQNFGQSIGQLDNGQALNFQHVQKCYLSSKWVKQFPKTPDSI